MNPLNLGHLLEGTIEQDPMSEKFSLRTTDDKGRPISVDLHELLGKYVGQPVRLTLISAESLQQLQELVEEMGGAEGVLGVSPRDIPVPINVRKPS